MIDPRLRERRSKASGVALRPGARHCRLCFNITPLEPEYIEKTAMYVYLRCRHCGGSFPIRHTDTETPALALQPATHPGEDTVRLFRQDKSKGLVHDNGKASPESAADETAPTSPVDEPPSSAADEVVTSANPDTSTTAEASPDDSKAEKAESTAETSPAHDAAADHWIKETEKAVATAREVGTPAAWRNAARAAVVVAEMAQTMRVTTHAHGIAEQLLQAAEAAVQQAQLASQAAADAMRTAEQTSHAAEGAAREAHVAAQMATSTRQRAEQMAQAAPKAVESARIAAQAAADAKARADELDQIVLRARDVNTPEAWNEAMQIAATTCAIEVDTP